MGETLSSLFPNPEYPEYSLLLGNASTEGCNYIESHVLKNGINYT